MPTSPRSRVLAVLLAALVLLAGANLAAYAANGQPLLLGKTGVATTKTTLKNNGAGPALHLKSRPGQPPLKVNRTKKVTRLNADLVDGHHAADLVTVGYRYLVPASEPAGRQVVEFPGLPPGRYLMTYNAVTFAGGEPKCQLQRSKGALSYPSGFGDFDINSGSAIVDTSAGPDPLTCAGAPGLRFHSSENGFSEVSFTRLDAVTESTPTVSRPGSRGPRGGPAPGN